MTAIPLTRRYAPRVLIAHDYLTQRGGAERVVLAMLEAFPGARLLTSVYDPDGTFPEFRDHRVETLWLDRVGAFRRDPRRALPFLASAVSGHRVEDVDVVLASSSGWAHGFRTSAPKIVYCHNPARWLYQPEDYVQDVPLQGRLALAALAPALRRWDRAAAASVTRYYANSTVVRERVRRAYGVHADLLFPPTWLDADGAQEPVAGVAPGFLLTVSRPRAYKNTEAICEAVAARPGQRLVVVGRLPERRGGWPARIIGLSGLSDAQMRWLYASARVLVAVSREDFGLTPVEGYGFGLPTVLRRAGGYLDSSVEGLTTVFVDGEDAATVGAGIDQALARRWDHDAIRRHALRFGKAAFQARLRDAVDEVLLGEPPAVKAILDRAVRLAPARRAAAPSRERLLHRSPGAVP